MLWDIFCRVIDNYGDLGVCWRLCRDLQRHGQRVRLWADDTRPLQWMADRPLPVGIQVLRWAHAGNEKVLSQLEASQVWVEAFACALPDAFVAWYRRELVEQPVWINLEYLSAEPVVDQLHGLPSPVFSGPGAGWTKWFFYPGFTPVSGGVIHEDGLLQRQSRFDRRSWLAGQGIEWRGERLVSLFSYRTSALAAFLQALARGAAPTRLLVAAGSSAAHVRALRQHFFGGRLRVHYLDHLPQDDFDHMLWSCDLNLVRGEDSWVRAILAGKALAWQPYVQQDGVHAAKLQAFLERIGLSEDWCRFHRIWSELQQDVLPPLDWSVGRQLVLDLRAQLLAAPSLTRQLLDFTRSKR